jgi:hypothetical protein
VVKKSEACPHCRMVYGKLRTGLTFAEVKAMLWSADSDPSTWRYRRARQVAPNQARILGLPRQHVRQS